MANYRFQPEDQQGSGRAQDDRKPNNCMRCVSFAVSSVAPLMFHAL